jgi:hypothetical protein
MEHGLCLGGPLWAQAPGPDLGGGLYIEPELIKCIPMLHPGMHLFSQGGPWPTPLDAED